MKLISIRVILFLTSLLIAGCNRSSPVLDSRPEDIPGQTQLPAPVQTERRLSLDEATADVRQEVFRSNPKMNSAATFPLREITTPVIWDRLHAQVFMVTEGIYVDESYIIDHGKTSLIGAGFGGDGIMSMCVADLAQNGRPQLVFTYSFGSGIHRSMVGVWTGGSAWVTADAALRNEDLSLIKIDDHTVRLSYGKFDANTRTFKSAGDFGAVHFIVAPAKSSVEIVPNSDLPENIKKLIM